VKRKIGPLTGWCAGMYVRFTKTGFGTSVNGPYRRDDPGVHELAELERVQEGHEVWTVYGPRGPYCTVDKHVEVCFGPRSPVDVDFLLG
jgi:hypothetical protein